jgi:hypothetical protein
MSTARLWDLGGIALARRPVRIGHTRRWHLRQVHSIDGVWGLGSRGSLLGYLVCARGEVTRDLGGTSLTELRRRRHYIVV